MREVEVWGKRKMREFVGDDEVLVRVFFIYPKDVEKYGVDLEKVRWASHATCPDEPDCISLIVKKEIFEEMMRDEKLEVEVADEEDLNEPCGYVADFGKIKYVEYY